MKKRLYGYIYIYRYSVYIYIHMHYICGDLMAFDGVNCVSWTFSVIKTVGNPPPDMDGP